MTEYVAETRIFLKEYTDERVDYYCEKGYVPTEEEVIVDIYEDLTPMSYDEAQLYNRSGVEILSVDDLAKNIQNLVSFNLDEIDESLKLKIREEVEYTDTIDAIYDILKRKYRNDDRFVEIKVVNKPRRAVHVETEKEIEDGETFNMDRYIYVDDSDRITMVSKDDKTRKFVDVEAVSDFFDEYLNS
jgi:hypothetical protein